MALIHCIGDNPLADACAKESAELLVSAYPNHSWWIECKGGVLIIKHLEASGRRGLIGMLRKMDQLSHDATRRKREILMAAGELLERANLARGARTDDPVTTFELDDVKMQKYWAAPLPVKAVH
jgi:hypothetical protein